MAEWFTADTEQAQARLIDAWPEAPILQPELCRMLLSIARQQVIAYAPAPPTDSIEVVDGIVTNTYVTPDNYVYAQLQQAMNLWNAGRTSSDGTVGDGAFVFSPRPLDKTVRGIIRPMDGKPHVL